MTDKLTDAELTRGINPFLGTANLLPLDVGHVMTLRRFSSPFLDNRTPGLDDLAFAFLICSRSMDDFIFLGKCGRFPELFFEYRAVFARIGADRAIAEFASYLATGVSVKAVIRALDTSCGPVAPSFHVNLAPTPRRPIDPKEN